MRRWLGAMLIAVCCWLPALAGPEDTFREGVRNYDEGQFEAAAVIFTRLAAEHPRNPEVLYNLGNAHFRAGDYPQAIFAYERALVLDRRLSDAQENLALARQLALGELPSIDTDENTATRIVNGLLTIGNAEQVALACLLLYYAATLLAGAGFWVADKQQRNRLWLGAGVCVGLLIPGIGSFALQVSDSGTKHGILLSEEVELRSEPRNDAESLFRIDGGVKVFVQRQRGPYYFVSSPQFGAEGWVSENHIGLL